MKYFPFIILSYSITVLPLSAAYSGPSDNSLRWASDSMPANIDFYQHTIREGIVLSHQIWDCLVYRDSKTGKIEPHLAQSYEFLDDQTLQFKLRQGVKFHNGAEMTADDVVATVEYVITHPTPQAIFFIDGVKKIDRYTVQLHLPQPFPPILEYLANMLPIYPKDYYAAVGPEGMGRKPVGTGPYKVTEVVLGSSVKMEAFDEYFGGVKGRPSIKFQEFKRIAEFNTQAVELMTGGLDWIWRVPTDAVDRLKSDQALKVESGELLRFGFIPMDALGRSGDTPLKDKRVRQAINHAINREAIRTALVGEGSSVINVICTPAQFGCSEEDAVVYDYDLVKARALLTEAGFPNGFTIDFYGYRDRTIMEAVMGDLARVGIKVNLVWLQISALIPQRDDGKTPMWFQAWGSNSIFDTDASIGYWFGGSGVDYAKDPRVLALLNKSYSMNPSTREEAYREALSIISKEAYAVPMFTYSLNYAYNADLEFTPVADETPRFFESKWKHQ